MMKNIRLIRFAIALLFFGLIVLGRWISPVDALDQYSLDQMNTGKWVTVIAAGGFIVSIIWAFVPVVKSVFGGSKQELT